MSENVSDVMISGRVRLARNYHDLPFATGKAPENARLCIDRACRAMQAIDESYALHRLADVSRTERMALVERHFISRDLVSNSAVGAALIREDGHISIMINEEDHLRIQCMASGLDLPEAARQAFEVERKLSEVCPFSFDPQLGYLTACPTNTGTGMRASLMLHLPMLTRFKQMGNVNQGVAKLGLTMRGIYGEGSEALGDLYQVSNQVTLGRTEEDIVEAVTAVGRQLIDMELKLRERCMAQQPYAYKDAVFRSYGALRYAMEMNEKEFMQHWSNLRLGAVGGLLSVPVSLTDELLSTAQNAHAKLYSQKRAAGLTVDRARCEIIRAALAPYPQEGEG